MAIGVGQEETKRVMLAETVVEFILCSRMKSSVAAPPQGVIAYPLPPTLLVLLDSADIQVVSLSRLLKPAIKTAPTTSTTKVISLNECLFFHAVQIFYLGRKGIIRKYHSSPTSKNPFPAQTKFTAWH